MGIQFRLAFEIISGVISVYLLVIFCSLVMRFYLDKIRTRKTNYLSKLRAEVDQLSRNELHWKRLQEELLPLDYFGRHAWLSRLWQRMTPSR